MQKRSVDQLRQYDTPKHSKKIIET